MHDHSLSLHAKASLRPGFSSFSKRASASPILGQTCKELRTTSHRCPHSLSSNPEAAGSVDRGGPGKSQNPCHRPWGLMRCWAGREGRRRTASPRPNKLYKEQEKTERRRRKNREEEGRTTDADNRAAAGALFLTRLRALVGPLDYNI